MLSYNKYGMCNMQALHMPVFGLRITHTQSILANQELFFFGGAGDQRAGSDGGWRRRCCREAAGPVRCATDRERHQLTAQCR